MYQSAQKLAIGMEHGYLYSVIHDQVMVGNELWDQVMKNALDQLRAVHTEIQTVIIEMSVCIKENMDMKIIPEELRHLNYTTDVFTFNAIVYRHYINFLGELNENLSAIMERL